MALTTSNPIRRATLRELAGGATPRTTDEALVRCRVERSAAGATVVLDPDVLAGPESPADRIELDLARVDPGSLQALASLFHRFFAEHPGARAGRVHATVRGRVVPAAFGFGHLAISRPVLQATEIFPESDAALPI